MAAPAVQQLQLRHHLLFLATCRASCKARGQLLLLQALVVMQHRLLPASCKR
jgi:hypothetical protein